MPEKYTFRRREYSVFSSPLPVAPFSAGEVHPEQRDGYEQEQEEYRYSRRVPDIHVQESLLIHICGYDLGGAFRAPVRHYIYFGKDLHAVYDLYENHRHDHRDQGWHYDIFYLGPDARAVKGRILEKIFGYILEARHVYKHGPARVFPYKNYRDR